MVVYQHRRNDNNTIFYVGIGKSVERAYNKWQRSLHWKYIVKKVGYSVEIVATDCSFEDAVKKERELIVLYGRKDLNTGTLVNLTDGGEGTDNLIVTEDVKKRISQSMIGKNTWMKGKRHNKQTIEKMRKSSRRLKHTEETKNILREAMSGSKNAMFGKLPPNTKSVIDITNGVIYKSMKECATANGIKITTFVRWMNKNNHNTSFKFYQNGNYT